MIFLNGAMKRLGGLAFQALIIAPMNMFIKSLKFELYLSVRTHQSKGESSNINLFSLANTFVSRVFIIL